MPSGEPRVEVKQFQGQNSATDPHDLAPGQAQEQVNCWSPRQGELVTRPGLRVMEYDTE